MRFGSGRHLFTSGRGYWLLPKYCAAIARYAFHALRCYTDCDGNRDPAETGLRLERS